MGKVGAGFSMSVDGFISGPNDDEGRLFAWMFAGDTDVKLEAGDRDFDLKVSEESARIFEDRGNTIGAIVSGRRMFDLAGAWGGRHPIGCPVVVLTHHIPPEWANHESFTFVTEGGIEAAIAKAQEIAGDQRIGVGGANVTQQALKAGLLDEIGIDLVPVLLGDGVRLYKALGIEPVELKLTGITQGTGVIHLGFDVIK